MLGMELSTGAWDGHVVVALRGELGVTGARRPHTRRLLTLTGQDEVFWVQASVAAAVAGLASCREQYA